MDAHCDNGEYKTHGGQEKEANAEVTSLNRILKDKNDFACWNSGENLSVCVLTR